MPASTNDYLKKTGASTVTALSSPGKAMGATSITVGSTTNYPSDTGIIIAIRQVNSAGELIAGTYTEWSATVTSGTTLGIVSTPVYGSDQVYTAGSTTQVYIPLSSYAHNKLIDGILVHADQDGTLKAGAVDVTAVLADSIVTKDKLSTALELEHDTGWNLTYAGTTHPIPSTTTYNGNRSYTNVYASSVASFTSEGMRKRFTRTVSAPTYMGGAFNGTSQYFTKVTPTSTLSTVTNNFTIMGWLEPTSYATAYVLGRMESTRNNGMAILLESDGRVSIQVFSGGVANFRVLTTYQSLPLNKKTHVAASWTSGTVVIYFDGVSVPIGAAATGGTAPTTAGTGGDFSIGRAGAYTLLYFPGYISGVGVFDAVLTAATIRSYSSQVLSGSETNCIGAWSLNNTGVNQQAAGTNDLTATGGVSYTVRSPYGNYLGGTLEYGIVTSVSSDGLTETIQVPEGCAIPTSGGVSAVAYSTQSVPYGFPRNAGRWQVTSVLAASFSNSASLTVNVWSGGNYKVTVPVGAWEIGWAGCVQFGASTSIANANVLLAPATPTNNVHNQELNAFIFTGSGGISNIIDTPSRETSIAVTSATDYIMYASFNVGSGTVSSTYRGDLSMFVIKAIPAYL